MSEPRTDALMAKLHDQLAALKRGIPMQEPFEQMEELARQLERDLEAANRRADARAREACTLEGRTGCSFRRLGTDD